MSGIGIPGAAWRAFALAAALGACGLGCGKDRVTTPGGRAVVWTRVTDPSAVPDPRFPDWRADRIVFSYAAPTARRLAFVRSDSTVLTYLVSPSGRDSSARWLTDTTLIESSDISGSFDLWARDTTGTAALRAITAYPGNELSPAPRPGAPGVAYVEVAAGVRRLVLLPDTIPAPPARVYLTGAGLSPREPDWNPTGQMICFSADSADGSRHIWAVSLTDTIPRQLTTGPYHDDSPRVSPDGTRILFTSDRKGSSGIWLVSPAGEGALLQVVVFDAAGSTSVTPCWSPDGTRIAVSSDGRGYGRAIWILSNLP